MLSSSVQRTRVENDLVTVIPRARSDTEPRINLPFEPFFGTLQEQVALGLCSSRSPARTETITKRPAPLSGLPPSRARQVSLPELMAAPVSPRATPICTASC